VGRRFLEGADFEEEGGFAGFVGLVGEDGDVAVGVEAMDDPRAWRGLNSEALSADGDASVGADLDGGPLTPDIGPPRADGGFAKGDTALTSGEGGGGVGGTTEFTVDFVGVAVTT